MDHAGNIEKVAGAIGTIKGAVEKFEKGGTMDVVGGMLEISNAVSQFLPPPASMVTGAVSSIFNIFGGGPPSTEDIVMEEFRKQTEWMDEKFTELDRSLKDLKRHISNQIQVIQRMLDKQTEQIGELMDQRDEKNRQLEVVKDTKEKCREAKGMWREIKTKRNFILPLGDQDLDGSVVQTLSDPNYILTQNIGQRFIVKDFVRTECKGSQSPKVELMDACLSLAFVSLMVDFEQEKLIDQTLTIIVNTKQSDMTQSYIIEKETLKSEAKSFLKLIFLSVSEADFCGLSTKGKAKLDPEQKQQLISYAEHLEPGLGAKLDENDACGKCLPMINNNNHCQRLNGSRLMSPKCVHIGQ